MKKKKKSIITMAVNKMERKDDLELKQLGQFRGTTQYHKMGSLFGDTVATDGVAYIMKNGYGWFVTDALAVIIFKFRNEPFISIKLKLLEDNKAKMILTDGNTKTLYTQEYNYTDAKKELNLYFIDNVILLSSEY